ASRKSWAGCESSVTVHGSSTTAGVSPAMARLRRTPRLLVRTTIAASRHVTKASAQSNGTKAAAIATSNPVAHAARPAGGPDCVSIRPACVTISGSSTKATAVPNRPDAITPVATGSSAYVTDAQTRTAAEVVTLRTASVAVIPASGTQPIRITSIASRGWPPSTVDRAAITASQGGVGVVEPIPAGWNDCT